MKTDALANGALAAPYAQGWPWIVVGAVAAAAGVVAQLQMTARMQQDVVAAMKARKRFSSPDRGELRPEFDEVPRRKRPLLSAACRALGRGLSSTEFSR